LRGPVNIAPPSAERSVRFLVLLSPFLSWTQDASITPTGARGRKTPLEHVP
jgi:hypothetical protein